MADGRGGARKGAGRPAGSKNKITEEKRQTIAEMASEYTEDALNALVNIVRSGESENARVAASNAILDRAYGKPAQSMDVSNSDGSLQTLDPAKLTIEQRKALLGALVLDEPDTNAG